MTSTPADVWKWIDEQQAAESIDETWRSARQLAAQWKISQKVAKAKADAMVAAGVLESRRVVSGCNPTTFYRPKEQ